MAGSSAAQLGQQLADRVHMQPCEGAQRNTHASHTVGQTHHPLFAGQQGNCRQRNGNLLGRRRQRSLVVLVHGLIRLVVPLF